MKISFLIGSKHNFWVILGLKRSFWRVQFIFFEQVMSRFKTWTQKMGLLWCCWIPLNLKGLNNFTDLFRLSFAPLQPSKCIFQWPSCTLLKPGHIHLSLWFWRIQLIRSLKPWPQLKPIMYNLKNSIYNERHEIVAKIYL